MRYRQRDFPDARRRAKRLRREMTPAEIRFWDLIRTIDGFHWRRQHPLGPHVFDFAELGQKLLIEIDGGIHDLPKVAERDTAKEAWAVSQGYRVLRIPNAHVFGTGEPVLAAVMYALRERRGVAGIGTR